MKLILNIFILFIFVFVAYLGSKKMASNWSIRKIRNYNPQSFFDMDLNQVN